MSFRRRLPSLTALMTLEAVFRHRSFTAAAAELGVTQAAVSRQIALLEDELGLPMFVRKHRAIEPTPGCLALAATLTQSFSNIADVVEVVGQSQQGIVTIGATVAFSSFWLLPRLAEFRRQTPGVQIRVVSQDSKIDLNAGGIDIVIRYGQPPFADGRVVASREDTIVPVCSPEYFQRRKGGGMSSADEFIETDAKDKSWMTWSQWHRGAGCGLRIAPQLHFNHYTEAIAAARAGQGIALGWRLLVQTFLDDGTLVSLEDAEMQTSDAYHVVVPSRPYRSSAVEHASVWLAFALSR
ncbi:LysR family transcriptional regulator [bacterium M00.F.Ca.ET.194.01.1.1]|nr:LysR family transcriptional regulator [bacterium M00.F.Ca.ET.194.01.1.1]TGS52189.1 LysR family transcriptional regulator [bacterium M00.F.Ca.ET.179.01.1.1]TGV43337.1 LysR family transcriptional regulator [bacterium M00.F.Ca.ET.168.01.1.1]